MNLVKCFMYVIDVQQQQINADMMIDANAAITLLEKRAQKILRLERDSNTHPLRYGYNAFPTELSTLCVGWPFMFSGLNTRAQVCQFHSQGSTFRKEPWGELAPKFSDLVASKSISFSEKHGKLVASEKKLVSLATPAVAMSNSEKSSNISIIYCNDVHFLSLVLDGDCTVISLASCKSNHKKNL